MENFDAEQPMEDLQEQTPKKEPKNPLYDCYSLLHDLVYIWPRSRSCLCSSSVSSAWTARP